MNGETKLKPCPLCGSKRIGQWDTKEGGIIKCYQCGIKLERDPVEEWYEQIDGDLYRKHPRQSGLEVAAMWWNDKRISENHDR